MLLLLASTTACLPPPTPSPETCEKLPCVRKCCLLLHGLNLENRSCVEAAVHPMLAPFRPGGHAEDHFTFLYGLPSCRDGRFIRKPLEDPEDIFEVSLDGSLFFPSNRLVVNVSSYCIDVILNLGIITAVQCSEAAGTPSPITIPSSLSPWEVIQPVCLLLSVPFMAATVLLYCFVPRRRKLHAWSVMSHVSSLAVGMTVLGINQLFTMYLSQSVCVSAGTLSQ